ncbi:MAG TPA: wax ester/triacylglycerol synthase family O-acyltransferase [Baekduia sp.]|nr:wax ester/triacylglycerol synthase family O-acyltransferase [Baekduia sp.]
MRQLSAMDAQFFAIENDRNYGHVGSVAILDPATAPGGRFDAERLKELIARRLHLVPPFTWRLQEVPLGLDWPYWVEDEHFDLDFHVRELALPAPGSMAQLVEQTGRIYSRRLDRARPLWELYVVHGLEGGRMALVSKVHHAAVDGMSGGEILAMLYDLTPEPRDVGPADGVPTAAAPGALELVGRAAAVLPRAPRNVAARAARLLPHLDAGLSALGAPGTTAASRVLSRARAAVSRGDAPAVLERPPVRPPRGAYDGRVSPHRIFGLGSLPLTEVKRVKDHFGVKVNDVVTSLVAGAAREHLLRHDALPDRPLVAQIPVSVRTDAERGTFGNQISVMLVAIPTDVGDPVQRLRATAATMRSAKERHNALPAKALQDLTTFLPAALHARAARRMVELSPRLGLRPPFNIIVSNVPGPPVDIYVAGARLEALHPLSIITDGAGINVTVMSYRDAIDVGITADREQTPDVQTLVEGMRAELDALGAATGPSTGR